MSQPAWPCAARAPNALGLLVRYPIRGAAS